VKDLEGIGLGLISHTTAACWRDWGRQRKNLSHDIWRPGGFSNTELPNCKPQT